MLIDEFMTTCCFMEATRIRDGAGGYTTTWTEGETFQAAITMDSTLEARVAEHEGVTSVYSIVTSKAVPLAYDTKLKRLSDGRYFRVTSDGTDQLAPASSTLDISRVSAERWELTT